MWESCSDSVITFNDEELMNDLAYIVENDVILEAIRRQLSSLSDRVEVRYQTSAKSYIIPGSTPGHDNVDQNTWVTIETDKGQKIQTKLLVRVLLLKEKNRNKNELNLYFSLKSYLLKCILF